jgi:hypothetical protein
VDVANFEGFPLGNGGHEQDPVIVDIPDLQGGEGKEGHKDQKEKEKGNEEFRAKDNRFSLIVG